MNTQTIDQSKVNIDALKINLKDSDVSFGPRSGPARLIQLAVENDVAVPMLGDEEEKVSRNVVPEKYRAKYGKAQNCGDEVALALKDFTTDELPAEGKKKAKQVCSAARLQEVADQNGIDLTQWAHVNLGMRRMNLGNVLRGRVNRGEKVQVGKQTWEAKPKADEPAAEGNFARM